MTKATLAGHEGLSLKASQLMANACDLTRWEQRGWIGIDLDAGCFRLTRAGREQANTSCGNCRSWQSIDGARGYCKSADRVDDGKEHAGITREYETCEVHHP